MKNKEFSFFFCMVVVFLMLGVLVISVYCVIRDSRAPQVTPDSGVVVNEETQPREIVKEHHIDNVVTLAQNGLRNGCETYACTMTLQTMGYDITEYQFADNYLYCYDVYYGSDGNMYGPDMNCAFAGTVYDGYGYGINSPAMAKCMNKYLTEIGDSKQAIALSGVSLDELCQKYVANDIPVMVWATTYMDEPYEKFSWIVEYVDENARHDKGDTEVWLQNEHCMMLCGFDEENYYFGDSVSGGISCFSKEISQERYAQLGYQAIVVK